MAGNLIQVGSDGALRVATGGGIVVGGATDPCCCGDPLPEETCGDLSCGTDECCIQWGTGTGEWYREESRTGQYNASIVDTTTTESPTYTATEAWCYVKQKLVFEVSHSRSYTYNACASCGSVDTIDESLTLTGETTVSAICPPSSFTATSSLSVSQSNSTDNCGGGATSPCSATTSPTVTATANLTNNSITLSWGTNSCSILSTSVTLRRVPGSKRLFQYEQTRPVNATKASSDYFGCQFGELSGDRNLIVATAELVDV